MVKSNAAKIEAFTKEEHAAFEKPWLKVEEHEEKALSEDMKADEEEIKINVVKSNPPARLFQEHSFDLHHFNMNDHILEHESLDSSHFMMDIPKMATDKHESVEDLSHLNLNHPHGYIDNKFEFDEDHDHDLHSHSFLNEAYML